LTSALVRSGKLPSSQAKDVAKAVIKRENEASTGMGKGVAVPHVKHASAKSVIGAVGLSAAGIDFASLDEQPVYSVILLISLDNPDKHLQTENMFKHLEGKFASLRQCRTPRSGGPAGRGR
jgi:mannitol/fructose-specific phosphotransferase system IIA component (Ntr-type)